MVNAKRWTFRLVAVAVLLAAVGSFLYAVWRTERPVHVVVRSDPPRASVFGDRGLLGTTPLRLTLLPGEERLLRLIRRDCRDREILVKADAYQPHTFAAKWDSLFYDHETAAPVVDLPTTRTAALSVTAEPSDARVYLDGQLLGTAPLRRGGFAPGEHALRVLKDKYYDYDQVVVLSPDKDAQVHAVLKSKWVTLYHARIRKEPGAMMHHTELVHELILHAQFDEAVEALWQGYEGAKRKDARDQHRFYDECWRIYTHYYFYPREGADERARPACKELIKRGIAEKAYNERALQRYLDLMNKYDKTYPPKKK